MNLYIVYTKTSPSNRWLPVLPPPKSQFRIIKQVSWLLLPLTLTPSPLYASGVVISSAITVAGAALDFHELPYYLK